MCSVAANGSLLEIVPYINTETFIFSDHKYDVLMEPDRVLTYTIVKLQI